MREETYQDVFVMSPHDDVKNFVQNAVGIYLQRTSRGKSPPRLIFKSERQRATFHQVVSTMETSAFADTLGSPAAFLHLRNASRSGSLHFGSEKPVKVYVQGHGAPGDADVGGLPGHSYIWDGASSARRRKAASARDTAAVLIKMGLPEGSLVRVNSCWSGTSSNITPDMARSALETSGHVLGLMGAADRTFAGNLHAALASRKPRTRGYPAPTMRHPCETGFMVASDRYGFRLEATGKAIFVVFSDPVGAGNTLLNVKRGTVGRDY